MRTLTLMSMVGLVAMAACGNANGESQATDPAPSGTYKVILADGSEGSINLNTDASFALTDPTGQVVREGTWRRANGQFCLNDKARPREVCMDEAKVGTDGGFDLSARGKVVMQFRPAS